MSPRSTCSLSEALTALAFDDPLGAAFVPLAIKEGRWKCTGDEAFAKIIDALNALCDASYHGNIKIFGRSSSISGGAEKLQLITPDQCVDHRLFVPGHDTLWQGCNQGKEYEDSFTAFKTTKMLSDIQVDFAELTMLIAAYSGKGSASVANTSVNPFTLAEIDAWIEATNHTGMKKARNTFMQQQRAKGLSSAFEKRWQNIKNNSVGRPRKQR